MLKKLHKKIITITVIVIILFVFLLGHSLFEGQSDSNNVYKINAEIKDNTLIATMDFEFFNNTDQEITELYFCLYPNAFKNEENILNVAVPDMLDLAYPSGFDSGYIDIRLVKVSDKEVTPIYENDGQILKLNVPSIKKNEKCCIFMEFSEKLPNSPMRYGYGGDTYNFGNWYPVLCPIIDGQAQKSIYTANGDPFFSECADYFISIKASNEFRLASSGEILTKSSPDPINFVWTAKGENIRDFAFVLSKNFKLKSQKVGETIVYSYYLENDTMGQAALDYAVNALNCFNEKFGMYPYTTLSVVAADFYIGGMEYPNLVLINKELYSPAKTEGLEEVIVHELAHQWWYGLVGNNEISDAWLDEGLTQYSVALFYEDVYGFERYKSFLTENESYCKVIFKIVENMQGPFSKEIERKSTDFEHWLLYNVITYDVSALMLDSLRNSVKDEVFFSGLKLYFEENKYGIATKQSFISAMEKSGCKNASTVLEPWLKGKVYWG